MPGKKPILILQMQRMGDLILSFPLMIWLARRYPGHPIFVAAEETFYKPLMKISPAVTYFPWTGAQVLKQHSYELVVNLSIQEKAACLAFEVEAERKVGPVQSPDGGRYVHGDWQLYRASLVKNNRYNRYHWADLNSLDVIPYNDIAATRFDVPRTMPSDVKKVGLFIGASEAAKRPAPLFWAELVGHLLGRGLIPILFGGPAEVETGREVERLAKAPILNLCGQLGLEELSVIGQTLALFVTPDTGPMHLSSWAGLKCLNVSMGNVNPWETGPYPPGHLVLRADMECAKGCWHCTRSRLHCHDPFDPKRIAALVVRIVAGASPEKLGTLRLPGLALSVTGKQNGLYHLARTDGFQADEECHASRFWRFFFGARFNVWSDDVVRSAWRDVADNDPELAEGLLGHISEIGRQFQHGVKTGVLENENFWSNSPAMAKPFTGFIQMRLENGDYSRYAWAESLQYLEALIACCR